MWPAILAGMLCLYCGDGSDPDAGKDRTPPEIVGAPSITANPNPAVPLAGILALETNEAARVVLDVTDGTEDSTIPFEGYRTQHSLPVLGFKPGREYTIRIAVEDPAGNRTDAETPLFFATEGLPAGFPPMEIKASRPDRMEPGVTLFDAIRFVIGEPATPPFYLIAVDEAGDVVWYYETDLAISDARRISDGNLLLMMTNRTQLLEIDMLGNVTAQWHSRMQETPDETSVPVDTNAFHHEVFEMPSGNLLVLSSETRTYPDYPSSDSDPDAPRETATVAGDVVVEFSRDGTIVNQWPLLDMLDPYRIGYDSLGGFWDRFYPEQGGTRDWAHANAVIYDPEDDTILVSCRHQDVVFKFHRNDPGDLVWLMGPHGNWASPLSDYLLHPSDAEFSWNYHQHAPMITPEGNILLFDNGNYRALPFAEKLPASENYSRAVEYSVNGNTMEIAQVWEYGSPDSTDESIYAPWIGDADYLPETGNVLITFGGITTDPATGLPSDQIGAAKASARLIEVRHSTPAEKVFDLRIGNKDLSDPSGWVVYRSEHLKSLYP